MVVMLVTGARSWDYPGMIRKVLLHHGPGLVRHGAARGVDLIADRFVRNQMQSHEGWDVDPHPVSDEQWARSKWAGNARNQRMVDARPRPTVCLAFPGPESRGTYDCIVRAAWAGIDVVVTLPPEVSNQEYQRRLADRERLMERWRADA